MLRFLNTTCLGNCTLLFSFMKFCLCYVLTVQYRKSIFLFLKVNLRHKSFIPVPKVIDICIAFIDFKMHHKVINIQFKILVYDKI